MRRRVLKLRTPEELAETIPEVSYMRKLSFEMLFGGPHGARLTRSDVQQLVEQVLLAVRTMLPRLRTSGGALNVSWCGARKPKGKL